MQFNCSLLRPVLIMLRINDLPLPRVSAVSFFFCCTYSNGKGQCETYNYEGE